ncbi:glucose-6-phosphate isomerase [Aquabacterium sp. A08]|uniref:glucose-6-phosphate isomerase n=1 Tax=Aquabacterium sp. A08 TaxID=2718532 RepID=UPI001424A738|nr:glucose-6-phosphate isomerase [Aquabacterium sp. A08]NIC41059.1 glucose-6-phosphate isomerase [Aquabacterium sp. A08]
MRHDQLPAWQALREQSWHYQGAFDLRRAFAKQPGRFEAFRVEAPHVVADLSKNLWDGPVLDALCALADTLQLPQKRAALLAGEVVNPTEGRPALHACVRGRWAEAPDGPADPWTDGLRDMLALAEAVRADPEIDHVVHLGIGGSGLGPELAVQALAAGHGARQRLHFVANVDGHELQEVLSGLPPQRTLFVVASKSWSTAETLQNARTAQAWMQAAGVPQPERHFVAISAKAERARAMGMGRVLHMPDGVGGRFSLWSAVGLPVAVALGAAGFAELLAGAVEMDRHFATAPLRHNLPVCLGLLDVWNSTFLGMSSRCVAPYHHGLRRLPAYLQQLEMESNGKGVCLQARPLPYTTTAAVWGEPGSNGQHAFFQWLHQGTQRVPTEFTVVRQPRHALPGHHEALLANAFGQAQALMQGGMASGAQLPGHQDFPGNRPSTMLLLDALTPRSLGALLAMHEHRVFVASVVWGINCFDQWGVELGKTLALDLQARMRRQDWVGLDASTAGLMQWAAQARTPVGAPGVPA